MRKPTATGLMLPGTLNSLVKQLQAPKANAANEYNTAKIVHITPRIGINSIYGSSSGGKVGKFGPSLRVAIYTPRVSPHILCHTSKMAKSIAVPARKPVTHSEEI